MPYQRYLAEFLGTFALTFVVWLSIAFAMPFPTPIMAALTIGLFVYTIGRLSGAHYNPAITLAQLSIRTITAKDAAFYVLAQLLGASAAMFLGALLTGEAVSVPQDGGLIVAFAEALGTFFLAFGVTAVITKSVDTVLSGLVVGLSLFIGIYIAFPLGNGNVILNPAVALGIGSFSALYILGPVIGALGGAWAFDRFFRHADRSKDAVRK